jgi:uncharacterized protein (TIGR04222 family)
MHPWGLSGPQFLWLYAIGLVVGVVVAIRARRRVRTPRLADPPPRLSPEELGFLAGGPGHAVQIVVARLYEAGLVRVSRGGEVSRNSSVASTGNPFDDAVLAQLKKPRTVPALARKQGVQQVITKLGESLVRSGMLVAPARALRARRRAMLVLYAVFAVGIVRWVNGIAENLPVGYLTGLLVLTLVIVSLLNIRAFSKPKARTVHGDRAVAAVRAQGSAAHHLEQMAVSGAKAHPDPELSHALALAVPVGFAPAAWSYASAGSFSSYAPSYSSSNSGYSCSSATSSSSCSSSSSSCSSGSSCGGGGCGGGSS